MNLWSAVLRTAAETSTSTASGVAGIIGALALLVTAIGTLRNGRRTKRVEATTKKVNAAVNDVAPNEPTTRQLIEQLAATVGTLAKDFHDYRGEDKARWQEHMLRHHPR